MRFVVFFVLLFGVVLVAIPKTASAELSPAQRVRAAQELVDALAHRYGPLPYKEKVLGISFSQVSREFLAAAESAPNDTALFTRMTQYISRFEDAHLRITFPSSWILSLGFGIDKIGDEFIISWIDRTRLPHEIFPFDVGDRVIAFDGKPIAPAVKKLSMFYATGYHPMTDRLSANALANREQSSGVPMPPLSLLTTVVIESFANATTQTVSLPWQSEGASLAPIRDRSATTLMHTLAGPARTTAASSGDTDIEQIRRLEYALDDEPSTAATGWGTRYPVFPLWNELVLRTTTPFLSGVIVHGTHRIGYLRIHSWSSDKLDFDAVHELMRREIPFLEETTNALILDQTGNLGGDICESENITRYFVTTSFQAAQFRFKPTRTWIQAWEQALEASISQQKSDKVRLYERIVSAFRYAANAGWQLTAPFPFCQANGLIEPFTESEFTDSEREEMGGLPIYSKPILLLVDELCCSMGDLFPAVMQDNQRATLFGRRTTGCGGSVDEHPLSGYSDAKVHITESLMVRPRKVRSPRGTLTAYVENVGVTPDIPYAMTADDFRAGFPAYREAVLNAVVDLIDTSAQP